MSSKYINDQRKEYSLYVLQMRAIPHAADGLKAAARRVLWTAKNGSKFKSATLSGATMPIHPHAAPESTINTLAAPYGNNIPLLKGDGAFGTLLNPTAYGASRYTSVSLSSFTKDVMFRDIEIIPLVDNYDETEKEPKHFLPLVPVVLMNPQEGIAVGFASNILPRTLDVIIDSQIQHLEGKDVDDVYPAFAPTENYCQDWFEDKNGGVRWVFKGEFDKVNATTIRITNLPYGIVHSKFISKLEKLEENGTIQEITDNSKNVYNIEIRFKKGVLRGLDDDAIMNLVGLVNNATENMNVIDFDGERVLGTDYVSMIGSFSDWRLGWYKNRYDRLAGLLEIDIQKYKDILQAIKKNVGGTAKKIGSRSELKDYLAAIDIVHIDYIADLPVYRFTEEERKKVEAKLADALKLMKQYRMLIKSEPKRRAVYIEELKQVRQNYKKGNYDIV
jgi:DNA gyrase subunit A